MLATPIHTAGGAQIDRVVKIKHEGQASGDESLDPAGAEQRCLAEDERDGEIVQAHELPQSSGVTTECFAKLHVLVTRFVKDIHAPLGEKWEERYLDALVAQYRFPLLDAVALPRNTPQRIWKKSCDAKRTPMVQCTTVCWFHSTVDDARDPQGAKVPIAPEIAACAATPCVVRWTLEHDLASVFAARIRPSRRREATASGCAISVCESNVAEGGAVENTHCSQEQ